ncbi:MAG TPA: hypothetical protein GX004_05710 [Firmicutes bacterium]|jgi:hypothetical protein|nr:hypothetical protein [Bacillota bacterium]
MVLLVFLLWFWGIVVVSVHFALTVIVYRDAIKIQRSSLYLSPVLWASISFSLPILGMFIYWIINHSLLKGNNN